MLSWETLGKSPPPYRRAPVLIHTVCACLYVSKYYSQSLYCRRSVTNTGHRHVRSDDNEVGLIYACYIMLSIINTVLARQDDGAILVK